MNSYYLHLKPSRDSINELGEWIETLQLFIKEKGMNKELCKWLMENNEPNS